MRVRRGDATLGRRLGLGVVMWCEIERQGDKGN